MLKKLTAILLALVLAFSLSISAFAKADITTAESIRFDENGNLRIMHITDTHLGDENVKASTWLIGNACDRENPDIVVLTGDIVTDASDKENLKELVDELMSVFDERDIPVAIAFGNHDSEQGWYTREEVMALYNAHSSSISVDEGEILSFCGTYNVPVLASESNEMKFNLWMFDNGGGDGEGHYSNAQKDQVDWYTAKSKLIEIANGGKVNSLVFQHVVVPEIYDALEKTDKEAPFTYEHIYNKGEYYRFDPNKENSGLLYEMPCPGYYNYGQFEAMAERGDVLGMFTGHDHANTFSIKHEGIYLVNTPATRYNGDVYSTKYGYRIIDVNENDTSKYTTKVVQWFDMYSLGDIAEIGKSDSYGLSVALKVTLGGFLQKYADLLSYFFVELFTGRTVYYK